MPAEWIARSVARVPMRKLVNGNIATCPVRLAFIDFFEPKKGKSDDGSDKATYGCAVLFPPGAEAGLNVVLWAAWCEEARKAFPNNWRPDGQPFGLHWPVHPCDEKQQYAGYTPGLHYMNVSSQFKPAVIDTAMNPIVDPSRVYPGVWAVLALNLYSYKNKKTGVSFGLQNVMLVGDDEKLGGGGTDPKEDFGHVDIDAHYDPAAAFGGAATTATPPMGVMPPPQRVGGYPTPAPALDYDPLA